ncbi:MAG: ketoacyl-ACP synthase III [Calditrichaeota bacterium]|nr:MAG: ketoacyl-ACP synthase III [Calditrichota bacterium]
MGRKAIITGVSHWVPEQVLTNKDLEKMVDTTDEWITTRTGIKERRILGPGKGSSYMGVKAAQRLLKERGISAEELDLIIVATVTPDTMFPNNACRIQHELGAKNAWGFDLNAACSGFIFALSTASQFIESGKHNKVLVVGTDKMSAITDYTDRTTCVLFGDAAACVLLEPGEEEGYGVLDFVNYCDGSGKDYLYLLGGGSLYPASHETVDKKMHYLFQDGKTVFKAAVQMMADVSVEILERNRLTGKDIAYFIPHQANYRIIDAAARRMGVDSDKVVVNIDRYGNTTAATIPMGLSEIYHDGKLKKGDYIVMAAFGAGYTWGSALVRWAI